jgi:hypothetical protein
MKVCSGWPGERTFLDLRVKKRASQAVEISLFPTMTAGGEWHMFGLDLGKMKQGSWNEWGKLYRILSGPADLVHILENRARDE